MDVEVPQHGHVLDQVEEQLLLVVQITLHVLLIVAIQLLDGLHVVQAVEVVLNTMTTILPQLLSMDELVQYLKDR
jgi:hypothetical protein